MKKFALKAAVAAIGTMVGAGAFAGSITSPATDAAATKYAVEGLVNTTDVTSPAIVYTMGVARTVAQDFTIIMTPSAGATFTAGTCAASLPTLGAGAGAFTATIKRASTTECAYEVDVTTATDTTTTLAFAAPVFDSHTLATAGNTASITLNLWDLGETARIDNSSALSRVVAVSGNALTLTATADTGTVADVNHANGPLFGFVAANDDTAGIAKASFVVGNNSGAAPFKLPDGVTNWDFNLHGTSIAVTVAGSNFTGLAATTPVKLIGTAPAVTKTMTTTASTATSSILPADMVGGVGNYTYSVTMEAAGNTSLGTSRVFGVSGVGDVATGADVTLAGNGSWWTWSANAIQLISPYFSNDGSHVTRFVILNTGATAATYSTTCYAETGNTMTAGAGASGSLVSGTNVITASDVCTFSGAPRGSMVFTINAPAGNIKGTYNQYNTTSGATSFGPMERPNAGSTF